MKIVIVRGPSLNEWEMQNYLPLAKKDDLLAIGSKKGHYGRSSEISTKKLLCLGEIFSFIPGGIKLLYQLFGDPQILLGLEKAIKNFDIVHTAETSNYYSYQALKARRKGLCGKLVVTCWENLPGLHEDYPAQRRIKKEVIKGADHFLAVTEQAKRALIADGASVKKITVIPMGVDLNKFKIQNSKFKIASKTSKVDKFTILFVGRLVEEKGVWDLLEAFRMICKQVGDGVDFRLRMVGSGPLRNEIVRRAKEWKIWSKMVIEERSYQEMPQVYQEADLLILPSKPTSGWEEQFGMVLVEGMASGIPIVATRTGAIPEVVDGAGILVEPGNIRELAGAIGELLGDERLRTDLVSKGLRRAQEEYNCQKVALKIEKLYRKILGD